MTDLGLALLILGIVGFGFAILGYLGDSWERRDARRRNGR